MVDPTQTGNDGTAKVAAETAVPVVGVSVAGSASGPGSASRQPETKDALIEWLQGPTGPGVQAFGEAADAMLRSAGVLKGAAPTEK